MNKIPFLNTDVEECISVRETGTGTQLAIIRSKNEDNMYYRIQKSKGGCTHSITLNKEEMKRKNNVKKVIALSTDKVSCFSDPSFLIVTVLSLTSF